MFEAVFFDIKDIVKGISGHLRTSQDISRPYSRQGSAAFRAAPFDYRVPHDPVTRALYQHLPTDRASGILVLAGDVARVDELESRFTADLHTSS